MAEAGWIALFSAVALAAIALAAIGLPAIGLPAICLAAIGLAAIARSKPQRPIMLQMMPGAWRSPSFPGLKQSL
jgi:hypothetical protein